MTKPTIAVRARSLNFDHIDPNAAGAQRFDEAVAPAASLSESVDPLDAVPAPADAFPSRAVVHIMSNRGTCTGWLFGPDIVVTAGHCLNGGGQPGNDAAWADLQSIRVSTLAADGETGIVPAGDTCRARRLYASDGWIGRAADDQDFGAIRLTDRRLGERLGWFGIGWSAAVQPGTPIRLTGYMKTDLDNPCVNFGGENPTYAKCMWRSRITGTQQGRLLFDADTHPGDSGSPVVAAGCGACAMAILTGRSPKHAATNSLARQATLISHSTFETLRAWRDED
jgi:glutamyl endopeptidase